MSTRRLIPQAPREAFKSTILYPAEIVSADGALYVGDGKTPGGGRTVMDEPSPWVLALFQSALAYLEANAASRTPAKASGVGHLTVALGSNSGLGPNAVSIGCAHLAVNDADNAGTFAQYSTGVQTAGRTSPLHMHEVDVAHLGATVPQTPQNINPAGLSEGVRYMAGGELPFPPHNIPAKTASTAILIGVNDPTNVARWDKGIVVQEGAISSGHVIAAGYADKISWYRNGIPLVSFNGAGAAQTVRSNAEGCYHIDTTFVAEDGSLPAMRAQLGRHDFHNHLGGDQGNFNVSLRAITLGPLAAGYQMIARNNDNQEVGVALNTQGMNSFSAIGNGSIDLGSSISPWKGLFLASNPIVGSDRDLKTNFQDPSAALLRAVRAVKVQLFQLKASVALKGEEARVHAGIVAQELRDAMIAEGLDWRRYAVIGEDQAEEEYDDAYIDNVPVMEPSEPIETVKNIDGVWTIVMEPAASDKQAGTHELVWNEDGSPAMQTIRSKDPDVVPVEVQRRHFVGKTTEVTRHRKLKRLVFNDDGTPKMELKIRYEQLAMLMLAAA